MYYIRGVQMEVFPVNPDTHRVKSAVKGKRNPLSLILLSLVFAILNLCFASYTSFCFDIKELLFVSLAACIEEILFRGLLLSMERKIPGLKPFGIVLMNGFIFGLFHLCNLGKMENTEVVLQVICGTALGIVLTVITLEKKSFVPSLLLHLVINVTGLLPARSDTVLYPLIWIGSALLLAVCSLLFLKNERKAFSGFSPECI